MKAAEFTEGFKCSQRFSKALWQYYQTGRTPVIPDLKSRSPEEGDLLAGRNPVAIAAALARAGAPVLSVVTESKFFGGSPALLQQIEMAVRIPVLRKDFVNSKAQLQETADLGASAVLLIASMLEPELLLGLVEYAQKLDLEPVVEVHDQIEINRVREIKLTVMGINNRNIVELEMDDGSVSTTEKLAGLAPSGVLLISESAIGSPTDVQRARAAGAHAVLVGTAILKAPDPVARYHLLSGSREV